MSFVLVFLSTALINAVEVFYVKNNYPRVPPSLEAFHDAFYFIIVSFATVGYGDVTPETVPTRYHPKIYKYTNMQITKKQSFF